MVPLSNVVAPLASVVLIAVPGPSVLFVIGRSLAFGWNSSRCPALQPGAGHCRRRA
ncbi:hypothetical protein ACLH0K_02870 [Arthrobacter sp. MPF02]|uniref:hypothetical protein n=1 Tax=Arthrobacter sp. MPF02 TaxID=3388492 RepID=UPI0039849717